jgi:hypothetical protein
VVIINNSGLLFNDCPEQWLLNRGMMTSLEILLTKLGFGSPITEVIKCLRPLRRWGPWISILHEA